MREALRAGAQPRRHAARCRWVPIVIRDGAIVGRGGNAPIAGNDPTAHAEIAALRAPAAAIGNYRHARLRSVRDARALRDVRRRDLARARFAVSCSGLAIPRRECAAA